MKRIIAFLLVFVLCLSLMPADVLAASGGWKHNSAGWWYEYAGGAYPANRWAEIGGSWYHFNASGYMQTGWLHDGGWYYLKSSGAMATGWQNIGGSWYFFDASGHMVTGWYQLGGAWYYFSASGAMAEGWTRVNGDWYLFSASGAMRTGWVEQNGAWYLLKPSGAMAANETVDGYTFNSGGVWVGSASEGTDGGGAVARSAGISDSTTVYVSRNGKIHTRSNCSGMKYYTAMPYGDAKAAGYDRCEKCF